MIINCKKIANQKLKKVKGTIKKKSLQLRMDIIYIGKSTASDIYIKHKQKVAEDLGIKFELHKFKKDVFHEVIKAICNNLNFDPNCNGYFIQLPIPDTLNDEEILNYVDSTKDVDCLSSTNLGYVLSGTDNSIKPATVEAILEILKSQKIILKSKVVTIVNDSNLIGKPLAVQLLSKGATVIVCNEHTKNLEEYTSKADILITATGKAQLIKQEMVKEGAIVIDAGIAKRKGKTVGDVDTTKVAKVAKAITSVPGGVGPLTIACLMENLLKAYEKEKRREKNH